MSVNLGHPDGSLLPSNGSPALNSEAAIEQPFNTTQSAIGALELEEACGGEAAQENEQADNDVCWSLWSNSFFVSGGLIYVTASVWDMQDPPSEGTSSAFTWFLYNALWTVGPIVYLFNSIIDVRWAWRVRIREKQRRQKRKYLRSLERQEGQQNGDPLSSVSGRRTKKLLSKLRPKKLFKRIRKHVGHRRDLSAAISFGIAAFLGLLSMLVSFVPSTTSEATATRLESVSTYCYLMSAVFALCGRRPKPAAGQKSIWHCSTWSNADRLADLGDAFFGIGSTVDVILMDMRFDDGLAYWPVISAVLWLLDALFYLRSDFVLLNSQTANYKEFDTGNDSMDMSDTDTLSGSMSATDMYYASPT